jgi:chromosome segregation ATPase
MSDALQLTKGQLEMLHKGVASASLQQCAADIIDTHAADRAALVAQVAELTREREEARAETEATQADLKTTEESVDELKAEVVRLLYELKVEQALQQQDCIDYRDGVRAAQLAQRAAEAEVTRLTRERDEAREIAQEQRGRLIHLQTDVTRLTKALASAEREARRLDQVCGHAQSQAQAAEARVRELTEIERTLRSSEANKRILAAIDAIESARLATGGVESAWAKQALRALRGDAR